MPNCYCVDAQMWFFSTNARGWNRFTELEKGICTSFSCLWYLCCACCFVNEGCADNSNEMHFLIHFHENLIAFTMERFWLLCIVIIRLNSLHCILFTGFLLLWEPEAQQNLSWDIIQMCADSLLFPLSLDRVKITWHLTKCIPLSSL